MKGFFSYDGSVYKALTKIMYVTAANLLFALCSIPIVTIGASATAMYTLLLRFRQGYEPDILKTFFRAFRDNFKKSTIVWLVMLVVAGTLGVNFYFLYQSGMAAASLIRVLLNLVLAMWMVLWVYIFPVIAYFENSVWGYLSFAFGLALGKLPYTISLVLLQTIPVLVMLFLAQYIPMAVLLLLCCGMSLPAYFCVPVFLKLFQPYGDSEE